MEDSKPVQNGKRKRKVNLKTDTGEFVSVTENDIELDVDVEFAEVPPPATNPRKQNKATKQNTPSVKAETERKSSKHHQNSPAVTNNSRSPGSTSSKQLTPAASPAKTSTEARAASTSGPPAASKRKRQRKGPVGDVIDLTDESEFSEVMDVKPNMPGDAAMALDGVQTQVAEVKPEKQSLDEVLSEKNNHTEITPKEEFFETVTQNTTSSSPTKKSDPATSDARASDATQGIQFRPDLAGNPEFLQDNLEAALAAIQDRMEKENLQHEPELDDKDGVIKDEIRGENVTNNTDVAEGEKEVESGQSETVPAVSEAPKLDVDGEVDGAQLHSDEYDQDMSRENENIPSILTFSDLLPPEENNEMADERSDSVDYSVIDDSGGESFSYCGAADGESAGQDDVDSPYYSTGQEADSETVDPVKEPVSENCGSQPQNKVVASLSCGFTETVRDSFSASSHKAGSQTGKLKDAQEESLMSSEETLKDNNSPSNSDRSCEEAIKLPQSSHKTHSFTAEDSFRTENIPEQALAHSEHPPAFDEDDIVSFDDLRDDSAEEHLHSMNKPLGFEDPDQGPSYILTQSAADDSVTSTHNIDSSDFTAARSGHNKLVSSEVKNDAVLKNSKANQCKVKTTCDQKSQTDIDMAAVKSVLKHCDSPPIKMFHHKDIQSKKELMNDQYSDKSSQVTDLTTNSEAQTDLTLSTNSQKKTDTVKSLHKDISVKTELLEKMEARLAETYVNIHKLLGFIVPSAELGDISNIHQVVTDMVKYSEASPQPIIKGSSKV